MTAPWNRLDSCDFAKWIYERADSTARRDSFDSFLKAGLVLDLKRGPTVVTVGFTRAEPEGEDAKIIHFRRSLLTGSISTSRISTSPASIRENSVSEDICSNLN